MKNITHMIRRKIWVLDIDLALRQINMVVRHKMWDCLRSEVTERVCYRGRAYIWVQIKGLTK